MRLLGTYYSLALLLAAPCLAFGGTRPLLKVPLGKELKLVVRPAQGCKAHFTASGFDSNLIQLKGLGGPNYKRKLILRITGLALGSTTITVAYTEKAPCVGSGSDLYQVLVVPNPKPIVRQFQDSADQEFRQTRRKIRDVLDVLKNTLDTDRKAFLDGVSNHMDVLRDAFNASNDSHFDIYKEAHGGLLNLRAAGNGLLSKQGVTETCLPDALGAGLCGTWDRFGEDLRDETYQGAERINRLNKKFYKSVEEYTDYRISGTYKSGFSRHIPGPTGTSSTPLQDPYRGLRITNSWAISRNTGGADNDTCQMIGGRADPGLGDVRVTATSTLGTSASKTVTPDSEGKWAVEFGPSYAFNGGTTIHLHASYAVPIADKEDHDDAFIRISLNLEF